MTCQAGDECLFGHHNKPGVTCFCPTDEKERNFQREWWAQKSNEWAQKVYGNLVRKMKISQIIQKAPGAFDRSQL